MSNSYLQQCLIEPLSQYNQLHPLYPSYIQQMQTTVFQQPISSYYANMCQSLYSFPTQMCNTINPIQAQMFQADVKQNGPEETLSLTEKLERIVFPDNPIREYCERQQKEIIEMFTNKIKEFDKLLSEL